MTTPARLHATAPGTDTDTHPEVSHDAVRSCVRPCR